MRVSHRSQTLRAWEPPRVRYVRESEEFVMTYRIMRVAAGLYAVMDESQPVPVFTGPYEACAAYLERQRLHLCRN